MGKTFRPMDGGTVTVSCSTTSADEAFDPGSHALRIVNAAAAVAFVKTAKGSALTATSADLPVAPGESAVIGIPSSHNIVAVVLASGIGNVYVTPGARGSSV